MALLDSVEWNNKQGEIIYRFPEGAISMGARLNVMENQEAVFFREGRALDSFGPGNHTLEAGSIPILEKLVTLPSGGTSPFPADVYYINKAEIPGLKWGTKQPIDLLDPVYTVVVPIRASGSFSLIIRDPRSFLATATGIWHAVSTEAVEAALRDRIIAPKLSDIITDLMVKDRITILKLAPHYDEIGTSGKAKLLDTFTGCGLDLIRFAVESITVPQDHESVKRLRKAIAEEPEIGAMGKDDSGKKPADDAGEKAAGSDVMSDDMTGAGMGGDMGRQMAGIMDQATAGAAQQEGAIPCPHCTALNQADAKYCTSCGKELAPGLNCPRCNAKVPMNAKFCPECGASLTPGTCVACGFKIEPNMKFCPECGARQG